MRSLSISENRRDGIVKTERVNRLVAITFIDNPENKPEVNHKDGHKEHNFVFNLEWATSKENSEHAVRTGLQKSGEESVKSKITEYEANMIIKMSSYGCNNAELGRIYGISKTQVRRIVKGESWKHLERL